MSAAAALLLSRPALTAAVARTQRSSADVSSRGTTHVVGQPGEWIGITNYDTAGFAGRHGLFSFGSGLDSVVSAQTGSLTR